jgi:hypothetical protein
MEIIRKSKLQAVPDPSWRCEEVAASALWVFDNLTFVAENYPRGISSHIDNLVEVRAKSYFDENGRLMHYELWRTHEYDKEYCHLAYEGVYSYGPEAAELTYWDEVTDKVANVTHVLDDKGFLVNDRAIEYPPFYLPFGHAIKVKYQPDPSWKKVEERWVYDHGSHKCLNVIYLGDSNEFRRFERWLCDDQYNPYMLMREEQVEIKANGERHVWNSRGGYQIEWSMGPVYMTPDGNLPAAGRKFPVWAVVGIVIAVLAALALVIL